MQYNVDDDGGHGYDTANAWRIGVETSGG